MTDMAGARFAGAGTFRVGDVLSKAIAIYGRRIGPFIILTVIAQVPQYIALLAVGGPTAQSLGTRVALTVVNFACASIASGAIIYGVVQDIRGRTFSVADSVRIALHRFLPMLGVAICTSILIFLASILLLIPGLIVACIYYVSMPACIAEEAGVFESMSRSGALTKGYRWQVFGLFILIFLGGVVLGIIVGAVFALTGSVGLLIATQAMTAIVSSFNGVLIGVSYYQLRVAKEGVDINKIASVFD
jgi:hypothetical protein